MLTCAAAVAYAVTITVWVATGHRPTGTDLVMSAWLTAVGAFIIASYRERLRRALAGRLTAREVIDQSTTPGGNDQLL